MDFDDAGFFFHFSSSQSIIFLPFIATLGPSLFHSQYQQKDDFIFPSFTGTCTFMYINEPAGPYD